MLKISPFPQLYNTAVTATYLWLHPTKLTERKIIIQTFLFTSTARLDYNIFFTFKEIW